MAKSSNQKLKPLYIMRFLMQRSGEDHPVSVAQIIEELARYGITAERKSIYDDIESLHTFGLDIVQVRGANGGYFIASRDFELPELKLLVDSVQSSKFITESKTMKLIEKIENLTNEYDAQFLHRQVYVHNRIKSMNESVYYNVDDISSAIAQDKAIRFMYFEYTVTKEYKARHDGEPYEASPFALMWDNENYYMLAWDANAAQMKHYRVDKMKEISILEKCREGKDVFEKTDMSAYSKKTFGMFTGEEQNIRLRFSNKLVGAVIDRFGRDVMLLPCGADHFTVSTNIAVSPQFYAWLFGFGTDAEIISPVSVRDEMKAKAQEIIDSYNKSAD